MRSGGTLFSVYSSVTRTSQPACIHRRQRAFFWAGTLSCVSSLSALITRRLVRQKRAMLRARDEGVVSEIEIHVEGGTQDRRFMDEIYRRGLTPDDLDAALEQSAGHGFKVRSFALCCGSCCRRPSFPPWQKLGRHHDSRETPQS